MHLALEPYCRWCGRPAEDVDHIVPLARGGTNDEANLQSLCRRCHVAKTMRRRVSTHA
jgi:5-methylcytosine-specific restriction protein A